MMPIPIPELPEPLVYILWTLVVISLIKRDQRKRDRERDREIDVKVEAAVVRGLRSSEMYQIIGESPPVVRLVKDVALLERSIEKAHKRIDEHLERKG